MSNEYVKRCSALSVNQENSKLEHTELFTFL